MAYVHIVQSPSNGPHEFVTYRHDEFVRLAMNPPYAPDVTSYVFSTGEGSIELESKNGMFCTWRWDKPAPRAAEPSGILDPVPLFSLAPEAAADLKSASSLTSLTATESETPDVSPLIARLPDGLLGGDDVIMPGNSAERNEALFRRTEPWWIEHGYEGHWALIVGGVIDHLRRRKADIRLPSQGDFFLGRIGRPSISKIRELDASS